MARRLELLPLVVGVLALLAAGLYLLEDATAVDITAAAAWAIGLGVVGLAGLALALRRLRAH